MRGLAILQAVQVQALLSNVSSLCTLGIGIQEACPPFRTGCAVLQPGALAEPSRLCHQEGCATESLPGHMRQRHCSTWVLRGSGAEVSGSDGHASPLERYRGKCYSL